MPIPRPRKTTPEEDFRRPSSPPRSRSGGTGSGRRRAASSPQGPPGSPRFSMVIPPPNVTGQAPHRDTPTGDDRGHPGPVDAHARPAASSGSPARTTPGSRRRWSWSGSSPNRGSTGASSAARSSSSASGPGSGKPRTRSSRSCASSAVRSTGAGTLHARPGPLPRRAPRFVQLFREGLIYRGRYGRQLVPPLRTAVSDLEVVHREEKATALSHPVRRVGRALRGGRRDDAARDDAGRHRARRSTPTIPARRSSAGRRPSCRSSAGSSR
jgi:hypothetical protein